MRTNILVYKFEGNTSRVRSIGSEYKIKIRRRKLKKRNRIKYHTLLFLMTITPTNQRSSTL